MKEARIYSGKILEEIAIAQISYVPISYAFSTSPMFNAIFIMKDDAILSS